jgi:hypothetical protein
MDAHAPTLREAEVVDGIQKYFDAALGSLLLYRFERIQYAEAIKSFAGKSMSEVYGAEHLLRLFGTVHCTDSQLLSHATVGLADHFFDTVPMHSETSSTCGGGWHR